LKNNTILKFLLEVLKPFKLLIIGQFTVAIFWSIYLSLRPYILKMIVDKIPNITSKNVVEELSGLIGFYVLLSLIVVVIFRFSDFIWLKFNPPLKRHVGDLLMKKMMEHSLTAFQSQFSGNLANKIKDVMSGIPDALKLIIYNFLNLFFTLSVAAFVIWTISYKFSLLFIGWLIIFVIGSGLFLSRAKKLSNDAAEVRSVVVGQMVDVLSNIISVHLFSAKNIESRKLKTHLDKYVATDQKRDWWFLGMFTFQGLSFAFYQAIGFVFLVSGFKDGSVTAGDFVLLLSINITIIDILWTLGSDVLTFSEIAGNITQGLRIALSPKDIKDKPNAKALKVNKGRIVFDQVNFHYRNTEDLFQNNSITIESGQKVGLVGYSGSGKTTFVNLILRLYDVTDGRILIDEQDIRDVTQDSLHSKIAMIPQDPSLFHRSLIENIQYGVIDVSNKEVISASKQAFAHDFITKLPEGYNTLVGERGVKLSGGQRQRIAIARAILKNAPILILDEATSQLDSITENQIQESLWKLMQSKTTIVIAHRLSTLLDMDRILVFDKGKIVEDGTHKELLRKNGLYRILWDAQVGGFLPNNINE